jgi:hypothetical protein
MKITHILRSEFLLVLLLLAGCASAPGTQLPGTTSASPQLENDTLTGLMRTDQAEDVGCNQRRIVNREVETADPKRAVEHWTLDRCGTIVRYTITYIPSPGGGTLIGLSAPDIVSKGPAESAVTGPMEFPNVWYRPWERGISLIAYSASGKLAIREERVVFGEGDDTLDINVAEIKSVTMGRMPFDTINEWAILRYGNPEKVAGFKDGSRLGWGTDTSLIYSTLRSMLKNRSAQPTR